MYRPLQFTLKHKNDTIIILLHVNVSKQVESRLEIQEATPTYTELNAEALGSSICGKLLCMSIKNCDTHKLELFRVLAEEQKQKHNLEWSYLKQTSPLYSLLSVTCTLPCHMAVRLIA